VFRLSSFSEFAACSLPFLEPCHSNIYLTQGHTLLARINGADAKALTEAIAKHVGLSGSTLPLSDTDKSPAPAPIAEKSETPEELDNRLRGLMNQSRVVLFMKGSPDVPRCGFSRKICGLLREKKIEFTHFDILTDESVRQGETVS
jgi:Glutaredoxin